LDKLTDLPMSSEFVEALIEATLQAVDNSIKHAPEASVREVRLRGKKNGLKIVVSDNGRGFRPTQIPKDRLGLRASIIGRVEAIGGRVFLNTRPGSGTTVVIDWGGDD
jgi:signal transduction histidine kinase